MRHQPSTVPKVSAPSFVASSLVSLGFCMSQSNSRYTNSSKNGRVSSLISQLVLRYPVTVINTILFIPNPGRRSRSESLTAQNILFCSSIAKMTASVATYPHEVVRTRLQTLRIHRDGYLNGTAPGYPPTGIIRTTKNIITKEGWRGLYKGLSVNLVRTVPNSAVTMLTFVFRFPYSSRVIRNGAQSDMPLSWLVGTRC